MHAALEGNVPIRSVPENLMATVVDEAHCMENWLVSAQIRTYIVSRQSHMMYVTFHANAKLFA